MNRKKSRDYFGVGVLFNKDEAGDSHYGTTQIGLSLSWVKSLSRKNHHIISLGVQGSYFQRSIDYTELYFPNQWNGNVSDNTLHNEVFTINKYVFVDFSAGAHYLYTPNRHFKLNSGVSVWHLTQPKQNLTNSETAYLNIKTQIYTEAEISTSSRFDILPTLLVALQGPYTEIVYGSKFYYKNK